MTTTFSPELARAIDLLAEAKMLVMVAARAETDQRAHLVNRLRLINRTLREHLGAMGGAAALPERLRIWARACELAEERLEP